jgi:hypothetical protein
MGLAALAAIVAVSLVIGIAVQVLDKRVPPYEWLIILATGAFGAYFASETLPGSSLFDSIKNWGPQLDGFFLIPGILGGAVLSIVAYLGTRDAYTTVTV